MEEYEKEKNFVTPEEIVNKIFDVEFYKKSLLDYFCDYFLGFCKAAARTIYGVLVVTGSVAVFLTFLYTIFVLLDKLHTFF